MIPTTPMYVMLLLTMTILLTAIIGCVGNKVYNVVGPDGRDGWVSLSCTNQAQCWKLAGEACPHGYTVVDGSIGAGTRTVVDDTMQVAKGLKDVLIQCVGTAHQMCGGDLQTHGCQGSTHWVPETRACEPC